MSEITDNEWQLLRYVYADLAVEELPEHRPAMLKGARDAVLAEYSRGHLAARKAAELLGVRDSADLLVALGDAGLPMPQPSEEEVKEQASRFAQLFRENKAAKSAEALSILKRAPDVTPEPGDELPE